MLSRRQNSFENKKGVQDLFIVDKIKSPRTRSNQGAHLVYVKFKYASRVFKCYINRCLIGLRMGLYTVNAVSLKSLNVVNCSNVFFFMSSLQKHKCIFYRQHGLVFGKTVRLNFMLRCARDRRTSRQISRIARERLN